MIFGGCFLRAHNDTKKKNVRREYERDAKKYLKNRRLLTSKIRNCEEIEKVCRSLHTENRRELIVEADIGGKGG